MWSVWLVFSDCRFHFVCPLMDTKVKVKLLSQVQLFVIPWTVAYQASLSMWFSRQEYWSELPFPILMVKDKRLMEVSSWERPTYGETGLVLMCRDKLSKSLVQYSVDEWDCVPSLLFDLRPNYGGSNEDNGNLLQKVLCMHCLTLQQATANPRLCQRLLDTHGQVWVSLLWGHCSFLPGPGLHKVLFVPSCNFGVLSWRRR